MDQARVLWILTYLGRYIACSTLLFNLTKASQVSQGACTTKSQRISSRAEGETRRVLAISTSQFGSLASSKQATSSWQGTAAMTFCPMGKCINRLADLADVSHADGKTITTLGCGFEQRVPYVSESCWLHSVLRLLATYLRVEKAIP